MSPLSRVRRGKIAGFRAGREILMLVGVDTGGTFTDLVLSDGGQLRIHKLLSTPHDPAAAILAGLAAITGGNPAALRDVAHGSTVATNAILERKGARAALITTQGFRDILAIGRQNRPELYALHPVLPPPLIPRERCFDAPERLDHRGHVITPLDLAALDAVIAQLAALKVEAVAVCFLYSYLNPAHERAARDRLVASGLLDESRVALSSDVLPEFREYERASTTALEAYVRPVMSRYLANLERQLPPDSRLRIMKSDGGVISAGAAREQAIQTALSGPAAGVIGAFDLAARAGFDHIITLDIGGTSTDVALCPGAPTFHPEREIDGLPLRLRTLDIETIGAGGGSIARLDAGGALRVGPESAGADPGSIIYGRGGTQVTVSDANAVLGRFDPAHFLGGRLALDLASAEAALEALGRAMGLSGPQAARGVLEIANTNIDRAVRRVSVARGHDPRRFTLVAFGGAGPLHACDVAARLSIPRVLVPRYPGVLCALGLLLADVALDLSRPAPQHADGLAGRADELRAEAARRLAAEGIPAEGMAFEASVDMRYHGQAYELPVPLGPDMAARFAEVHRARYGHVLAGAPVEAVNVRLRAVGRVKKPDLPGEPLAADPVRAARAAFLGEKTTASGALALYEREQLSPGAAFVGPALVLQADSTVYVAADWSARVDGARNLILERGTAAPGASGR
ncbi:MAG: hydantoinase/oxoprolinase family protein [Anaerolineae bacterium]|nr:hydantoinase/oxoprolinase family protein [Anaerolineae bacterium]